MPLLRIFSVKQFEDIILNPNGKKYVLFQFSNKSCMPCRRLNPALENFSNKFPEILFCDIEPFAESNQIRQKYNIRGLPTILIFEAGKPDLTYQPLIGPNSAAIENMLNLLNKKIPELDNF